MSDDTEAPDWEGVARRLLAAELEEQVHQLEDRTKDVAEQLENGEDITVDDLESILAGVEEYWYYVDRDLLEVTDIDELPENLAVYWNRK